MGFIFDFIGGAAEGVAEVSKQKLVEKAAAERDDATFARQRSMAEIREKNARSREDRGYEFQREMKGGEYDFQREVKGEDYDFQRELQGSKNANALEIAKIKSANKGAGALGQSKAETVADYMPKSMQPLFISELNKIGKNFSELTTSEVFAALDSAIERSDDVTKAQALRAVSEMKMANIDVAMEGDSDVASALLAKYADDIQKQMNKKDREGSSGKIAPSFQGFE